MDAERFRQVREVFLDAQRFRGRARDSFLAQRCGRDAELLKEVTELLRLDGGEPSVLDQPVVTTDPGPGKVPTHSVSAACETTPIKNERKSAVISAVGSFVLKDRLGAGALGKSYLTRAESDPSRVRAAKIFRSELHLTHSAAESVLTRLRVDHKALEDAGHTAAGVVESGWLPVGAGYVVSTYVPGESITAYADRRRLDLHARLVLFLDLCEAVEAAHRIGVIHGGIKPANVCVHLVGDLPQVRLLDTAMHRAVLSESTLRATWLRCEVLHGTPEYVPPEHAVGTGPVETTCDVYSLGALLYELLVGVGPFDRSSLRRFGVEAMQRIVSEEPPLEPSRRLAELTTEINELSTKRSSTPEKFAAELVGDKSRLVLRCLSKQPRDRYKSVADLAADTRLVLDGKAIASPPPAEPESLGIRMMRIVDKLRRA
ncbi:MAG: protein kinase [Phycisphaerales bacterium]|nr:protein kinase [Phycisphaerales bacterium]